MTYEEFLELIRFLAHELQEEAKAHLRADDDGMPVVQDE